MQNHPKMKVKFGIVCLSLVILLFSSIGFGAELIKVESKIVPKDSICVTPEIASKQVMDLERIVSIEKITKLVETQNEELIKQNDILRDNVKLEQENRKLIQDKFEAAEKLVLTNQELNKVKVDALEKDLKDASKPRWGAMGTSFGLGTLVAIIITVLL